MKEAMVYMLVSPQMTIRNLISKNVTSYTYDFIIDEEQNIPKVEDGSNQTIGGMIVSKSIKTTRTGSTMAFIVLEDIGTVEVIVFPRDLKTSICLRKITRFIKVG